MSEVEKFNCMLVHGFPCMMPKENGLWVQSANFDDAQSELAALREELAAAKQLASAWKEQERLRGIQAINAGEALTAAEQRNATLVKAATEFMEYAESGWDHFPDVGMNLRAALKPTESGASE
jgi:hypothetical protein